ncbi:MAG: FAD-dependent thymidylate synthase [bacterium]
MNHKTPKVTLLTWTMNPLETVYAVWQASKTEDELMTPHQVKTAVPQNEVEKLFKAVIAQRIPIGEHVDFVFMIENISVSWREHAVRHRIGTTISPERLGTDIVVVDRMPDLPDSSWWSQSMRIQDMSQFAANGQYRMPDMVVKAGPDAVKLYEDTMNTVARAYQKLLAAGVPMEDARELIPIGAQHRISWRLNIGSLQHIIGKRGCWILQLGIWGPVIMGMVNELATKVHPIFRDLVCPPCMHGDTFMDCLYHEENRRRYTQDDCHAPCPLHVTHCELPKRKQKAAPCLPTHEDAIPMWDELRERAIAYKEFWGRDPFLGHKL